MSSLQQSDDEAAAVATAPRVTLASMEAKVSEKYFVTAAEAIGQNPSQGGPLAILTICIVVLENGFTLLGKSAPAAAANFNVEFGQKLAYEDCIRQMWPLEGYLLRQQRHEAEEH